MAKSMRIAFYRGGTLSAEIAGGKEKKAMPHEPVSVPAEYGTQLVEDRFAYEVKGRQTKSAKDDQQALLVAELEKAVAEARAAVEAASDLDSKGAAQAALEEAEKKLADAKAG